MSLLPNSANIINPLFPDDGWLTRDPEEEGIDKKYLQNLENTIKENNYDIKSFLVVKNGYLVYEKYFSQSDTVFTARQIYSVTKSIVATLMGIAIDMRYINSTSDNVLSFFPDYTFKNMENGKENLTIEHLLKMASGLEWDEWTYSYNDNRNDVIIMSESEDWIQFVLNRPILYPPGTHFTYNSGVSHVLATIIHRSVQMNLDDFARANLFRPIGILDNESKWQKDSQLIPNGGWGLFLTPRAMARIGLLYLNNGSWNGKQIVSSFWIQTSTTSHISINSGTSYGYQWWIDDTGVSYSARGYKGQYIFVSPINNLTVTFTSLLQNDNIPYMLFKNYILPSLRSDWDNDNLSEKGLFSYTIIPLIFTCFFLIKKRKKN